MRLRPLLTCALTVTAAAAALTAIPAAAASTAGGGRAAGRHTAHRAPAAATLHVHGLHLAVGVHLLRTHLPRLSQQATVQSGNWSGYAVSADSGQRVRYVAANFNVPSLNCANSPLGSSGYAYVGEWAGLDGLSGGTIEQIGVQAYCDSSGTPSYLAFYEMYPQPPVGFTGIAPGDAVSVSVYFNGSAYNLVLTDHANGGSINTIQPCPQGSTCADKSAEVITEDPGGGVAKGVNLADFGMVNYTGTVVTSLHGTHGTLATLPKYWNSSEIVMVDSAKKQLAVPSGLYGGEAFNVAWHSAS